MRARWPCSASSRPSPIATCAPPPACQVTIRASVTPDHHNRRQAEIATGAARLWRSLLCRQLGLDAVDVLVELADSRLARFASGAVLLTSRFLRLHLRPHRSPRGWQGSDPCR